MAEESGLAKGFGGVWEWWVQNVLGGVGGISQSLAIVATFTMVIVGVLIYFLLRHLVLKQLAEKAGVQEEMLNGPSIVITISFLAITLWSGGIAMIAQLMSITVIIVAIVFIILLIYFVYSIGKQSYAVARGISASAGRDLVAARRSRLETRKEAGELKNQKLQLRREKETLSRFDKAKNLMKKGKIRVLRGITGLMVLLTYIRKEVASRRVLTNPQTAKYYLDQARRVYTTEISGEQYVLRAENYEEQIARAAGPEMIKGFRNVGIEFEKGLKDFSRRTGALDSKLKQALRSQLSAEEKIDAKAYEGMLEQYNRDIIKQTGDFNKISGDVIRIEGLFNKNRGLLIADLEQLKKLEKNVILKMLNLNVELTAIEQGIRNGNLNEINNNVAAAERILGSINVNIKKTSMSFTNKLDKIESMLTVDLSRIEVDLNNLFIKLKATDRDLTKVEQFDLLIKQKIKGRRGGGRPKTFYKMLNNQNMNFVNVKVYR
jgi:uncharacterized membrane protein